MFQSFRFSKRYLYTSVHNATKCDYYPYFELKDKVPRLPVPTLEHTFAQYQTILRPILDEKQFKVAKSLIDEFARTDAQSLQEELYRLDKEAPNSYIEGLWDTMYLELRCPNPINVNPVFQINITPESTQEKTAAKLISTSARFALDIHESKLPIDTVGKDKQPLCMTQYRNFFGTARVPQQGRDQLWKYIGSKHIVVLSNNQFYKLDIIDGNNLPLAPQVLENSLKRITEDSKKNTSKDCFGVLSAEDRDVWATQRKLFENYSPKNAKFLNIVDSSLFVLVLDEANVSSKKQLQELLLAGNQRWYDKIQLIVSKNSFIGVNMEHAPYDGATLLTYAQFVTNTNLASTNLSPEKSANYSVIEHDITPVKQGIAQAIKTLDDLTSITHSEVSEFNEYGKKGIIANKLSPDSFVQMAFQLAYYDIEGKPGSTYESAMTKRFYHGRTETLRSVSDESVHFTKTFRNAAASRDEKIEALRNAVTAHGERMKLAQQGLGVDRHLFALHNLAKLRQQRISGFEVPRLYTDESYSIMKTDMLSTSNCSSTAVGLFGFGATSAKGFGLGYIINDNSLIVGITNYEKRSKDYKDALEKALRDIQNLLQSK